MELFMWLRSHKDVSMPVLQKHIGASRTTGRRTIGTSPLWHEPRQARRCLSVLLGVREHQVDLKGISWTAWALHPKPQTLNPKP